MREEGIAINFLALFVSYLYSYRYNIFKQKSLDSGLSPLPPDSHKGGGGIFIVPRANRGSVESPLDLPLPREHNVH